jgi:mono/diheme cytochrome c family protein
MSENKAKKIHGITAEFDSVDGLLAACRRIRDAGYTKTDAFTPFAVHGIDKALGIKPTVLPWIVLACGVTGLVTALAMQIWMNAIDYPYIISGKPYLSLPAFIPVAFELTVLFSSFGAFFGMWALNGLPRFSNPIFTDPRFDRVTDDKFFLYIDAQDSLFNQAKVEQLMGELGGQHINTVVDDDSSSKVPRQFFMIWAALVGLSIIPILVVLRMRVTTSDSPRFHVFYDMDFSPAKDAQQFSSLFADGRAMRPDVPGTVARGQMGEDINFMTGIDVDQLTKIDSQRAEYLVRAHAEAQDESQPPAGDENAQPPAGEDNPPSPSEENGTPAAAAAQPAGVMDTTPWLTQNPLPVDRELLTRGQLYFGIYCSVCHGLNGGGNGLVNQRAQMILADTWIPPSVLSADNLYQDVYPDGKMFNTISNGIRKMAGYAGQIKPRDRWAIVAYIRALQQSQNATIDMVPENQREAILKQQAEVEQRLREQAEQERQAQSNEQPNAAG